MLVVLIGQHRPTRNGDSRVLVRDPGREGALVADDARTVRYAERYLGGGADARRPRLDEELEGLEEADE